MAKNSIDSVVKLRAPGQIVVLKGRLVTQDQYGVTFQYKPKGQRRVLQQHFERAHVAAVGNDMLYVRKEAVLMKITGVATTDPKTGFVEVDGIAFNPAYAEIIADLGVQDQEAPTTKKKKKAK